MAGFKNGKGNGGRKAPSRSKNKNGSAASKKQQGGKASGAVFMRTHTYKTGPQAGEKVDIDNVRAWRRSSSGGFESFFCFPRKGGVRTNCKDGYENWSVKVIFANGYRQTFNGVRNIKKQLINVPDLLTNISYSTKIKGTSGTGKFHTGAVTRYKK